MNPALAPHLADPAAATRTAAPAPSLVADLSELTKARLTLMVLLTTLGLWILSLPIAAGQVVQPNVSPVR